MGSRQAAFQRRGRATRSRGTFLLTQHGLYVRCAGFPMLRCESLIRFLRSTPNDVDTARRSRRPLPKPEICKNASPCLLHSILLRQAARLETQKIYQGILERNAKKEVIPRLNDVLSS